MKTLPALLAPLLVAGAALAAPATDDEPLEPDQAFRPSARLVSGSADGARHGIDIDYRIAPGYYLYRSRLRFEVWPPTLLTGPAELPPGIVMDDPFLGKSAIFRDQVTIHLPFTVSVAKPGQYKVRITAQGCAEDRVCYSPFPQEVPLTIPAGYRSMDMPAATAPRGLPR